MLYAVLIMLLGIVVGWVLRDKSFVKNISKKVSLVVTISVCLLLFVMGIRIGLDENIVQGFTKIGIVALVIFLSVIITTLFIIKRLTKFLDKNSNER